MKNLNNSIAKTFALIGVTAAFSIGAYGVEIFNHSGRSVTVTLTGEPLHLDLSGSNGSRGSDGHNGSRGHCGSHRNSSGQRVSDNRRGGSGGNGGRGGRGRNGGDATLIYENLDQVKSVFINASGGSGGPGGDGGRGGYGCPHGSNGSDGARGGHGNRGSLYLVSTERLPLQSDTSTQSATFATLESGIELTKQIWQRFSGAFDLLVPGSTVEDTYFMLQGYEHGTARIHFAADAQVDPALLQDETMVQLSEGVTSVYAHQHYWLVSQQTSGSDTTLEIERLYRRSEFDSTRYINVTGQAGDRKIQFRTSRPLSPAPELKLNLKVDVLVGRRRSYIELFQGEVSSLFISQTPEGYAVNLDRLPLSEAIIPSAQVRLTMTYHLEERTLVSEARSETWVVELN